MRRLISIALFLLLPLSVCFANQVATTDDGKKVILRDDGTWSYYTPPAQPAVSKEPITDEMAIKVIQHFKDCGNSVLAVNSDSHVKYLMINPSTIVHIPNDDPNYINIQNNHPNGDELKPSKYKKCLLSFEAKSVWDNKNVNIYCLAKSFLLTSSDPDDFRFFIDLEPAFSIQRVNPKLTETLYQYYVTVNDTSACPLKILAYQIDIDEYNTVNAGLVVRNTSKKPIVSFTGTFLMYDKMGHPVTWGGGSNRFNFLNQSTLIPASSQPTDVSYWALRLYDNTRKITPYIREIQFSDGTKWVRK